MPGRNKMAVRVVRPYRRVIFLIIDDRNRRVPYLRVDGFIVRDSHEQKVDRFYNMAGRFANMTRRSIRFRDGTTPEAARDRIINEFNNKDPEDLIIVYFHGRAFGAGVNYSWRVSGVQSGAINAYELISAAFEAPTDITFLLDCEIQTRWSSHFERQENNVEISAPPTIKDINGNSIESDGDFTESIVRNVNNTLANIETNGLITSRSFCEFTIGDKLMPSNFLRSLWCGRTKHGADDRVTRSKLSPVLSREINRLVMVHECIQEEGETVVPQPWRAMISNAHQQGMREGAINYVRDNLPAPYVGRYPDDEEEADVDVDEGYDDDEPQPGDTGEPMDGVAGEDNGHDGAAGDGGDGDGLFMPL